MESPMAQGQLDDQGACSHDVSSGSSVAVSWTLSPITTGISQSPVKEGNASSIAQLV